MQALSDSDYLREAVAFTAGTVAGLGTLMAGSVAATVAVLGVNVIAAGNSPAHLSQKANQLARDMIIGGTTIILFAKVVQGSFYVGKEVYQKTNEALGKREG